MHLIKRIPVLCMVLATGLFSGIQAQICKADYQRADSISKLSELVFHSGFQANWISRTNSFWYLERGREGKTFMIVDAEKALKTTAFDHCKLASELSKQTNKPISGKNLPFNSIEIDLKTQQISFSYEAKNWEYDIANDSLISKPLNRQNRSRDNLLRWDARDELSNPPVDSPDSLWTAFIRDNNLHIRSKSERKVYQLSFDGSAGEPYSSFLQWSPDSRKIVTNKVRLNTKRFVNMVESSPSTQLQPILHTMEYLKPGDALPIFQPALFDVSSMKKIDFDVTPFLHQYSLSNFRWRKDSRSFTFEFNQRGHQEYKVVEVNSETAEVKTLIHEKYPTFFCYSSKKYRYDVKDGEEIIWMSERDGWNHLYLINGYCGLIKNQITSGEWVVREVLHVDESNRQIYFYGSGKNIGEDPYHLHLYRVNFDGSNLAALTTENGNHQISFSPDRKYFTDTWSRVDQAPETVLRKTDDCSVVTQIAKADISDLIAKGWSLPEVFSAKGRDGQTDIWGMIYRPLKFDPTKQYPVIEYIYAGPHSAHVPKSFSPTFLFSGLAELGFIVVSIDGMGTSHRSKAFHDVCWQNLKDAGFPDRIAWMKAASAKYPYMDLSRVGIYGSSAGGQNAAGALLFHPDFYKVAVASVGCHDNRMDKIWWNEQWMGYPVGKHYEESSNVVNAHLLQGRLMLIVGELDRNVDPASTMQMADALIKANKDFELLVMPGLGHSMGGNYGERRRRDFFVKHLHGFETPDWNSKE